MLLLVVCVCPMGVLYGHMGTLQPQTANMAAYWPAWSRGWSLALVSVGISTPDTDSRIQLQKPVWTYSHLAHWNTKGIESNTQDPSLINKHAKDISLGNLISSQRVRVAGFEASGAATKKTLTKKKGASYLDARGRSHQVESSRWAPFPFQSKKQSIAHWKKKQTN